MKNLKWKFLQIPNFETYCLECNQQFETTGEYSVHLKTHSCQYICSVCMIRFKTFQKLEQHELKHENDSSERKFKCEDCGATFKTSPHLKQHKIFKHSRERSYPCEICSIKFKLKSELKSHSKIHQDVRPFKCTQCSFSFKK